MMLTMLVFVTIALFISNHRKTHELSSRCWISDDIREKLAVLKYYFFVIVGPILDKREPFTVITQQKSKSDMNLRILDEFWLDEGKLFSFLEMGVKFAVFLLTPLIILFLLLLSSGNSMTFRRKWENPVIKKEMGDGV